MELVLGDRVHDLVRGQVMFVERIDTNRDIARCWWRDSRGERRADDFWVGCLVKAPDKATTR